MTSYFNSPNQILDLLRTTDFSEIPRLCALNSSFRDVCRSKLGQEAIRQAQKRYWQQLIRKIEAKLPLDYNKMIDFLEPINPNVADELYGAIVESLIQLLLDHPVIVHQIKISINRGLRFGKAYMSGVLPENDIRYKFLQKSYTPDINHIINKLTFAGAELNPYTILNNLKTIDSALYKNFLSTMDEIFIDLLYQYDYLAEPIWKDYNFSIGSLK